MKYKRFRPRGTRNPTKDIQVGCESCALGGKDPFYGINLHCECSGEPYNRWKRNYGGSTYPGSHSFDIAREAAKQIVAKTKRW